MAAWKYIVIFAPALIATACGSTPQRSAAKSLTGNDYNGKKYYFGWGLNGNGDGSMDNEVKYDVLHTNGIFTKSIGGNYIGTTLVGEREVTGRAIKSKWQALAGQQTADDMYLQYSSGHGYQGGLEAGVTYGDIINATLAMPAKEVVIFTMACFSGGLVDAFEGARARWADRQAHGRTFFVMASSRADEESSTGPGTDPDEPSGPSGSAGSAFGHSLWKALIGYADKPASGGNGDGIVTLAEITHYVVADTEAEGGHTPVFTGSYEPELPIAKTPTCAEANLLLGDTAEGRRQLDDLMNDGVLAPVK